MSSYKDIKIVLSNLIYLKIIVNFEEYVSQLCLKYSKNQQPTHATALIIHLFLTWMKLNLLAFIFLKQNLPHDFRALGIIAL